MGGGRPARRPPALRQPRGAWLPEQSWPSGKRSCSAIPSRRPRRGSGAAAGQNGQQGRCARDDPWAPHQASFSFPSRGLFPVPLGEPCAPNALSLNALLSTPPRPTGPPWMRDHGHLLFLSRITTLPGTAALLITLPLPAKTSAQRRDPQGTQRTAGVQGSGAPAASGA